jgi:hypothetical protein
MLLVRAFWFPSFTFSSSEQGIRLKRAGSIKSMIKRLWQVKKVGQNAQKNGKSS